MDELKLKLSTKFMKSVVANLVSKIIYKKFDIDIDIELNEIELKTEEGKVHLHANVDAEVSDDEFKNIVKRIGL